MEQPTSPAPADITGVILAGGLSRRMNRQEKSFLSLGGNSLLAHVYERLLPQVGKVVLNANGDPARFAHFDLQVIPDKRQGFLGPLAGIEGAFLSLDTDWLLSIPVDTPFFPLDLAKKMSQSTKGREVPVVAKSNSRLHPVVTLWPRAVLPKLSAALDAKQLKLQQWFLQQEHIKLDFACEPDGQDPFFNINRPEDLNRANQINNPRNSICQHAPDATY
ncbi:MAG: molybdenum cofactor guanylyltransferase [Magnetococcales bacterium]|nr:molybdenum cofactor guanylyltransferase [Magnetococcales bacterium]